MELLLAFVPLFVSSSLLVVWAFWPRAKAPASRLDGKPVPEVQASASLLLISPGAAIPIAQHAPQLVAPSAVVVTVLPAVAITVAAPPLEAWEEKGWKKATEGNTVVYEGYYQIMDRSGRKRRFRGKVKMEAGVARPYIADPPPEFFANSAKASCLHEWREKPWWWLNWARAAHSVDQAIFYMERILDEALNN